MPVERYIPESIDDTVPPLAAISTSAGSHQYSSLADLLKQAGYKETRVYTPESEKRHIKRTLDEDDEINALYGAFGFRPATSSGLAHTHTRQTITEPSQPMKSSSSLLRRLALQDLPESNDVQGRDATQDAWWGGGIAASLGRAAKAVMSPPVDSTSTLGDQTGTVGLGLGLMKSEGVRKVKSNWELDRTKRGTTAEPEIILQEQRKPSIRAARALTESPKRNHEFKAPPPSIQAIMDASLPPLPIDEDAFGYSPLPADYEDQCDEDAMYGVMDDFRVGSLGSSESRSTVDQDGIPEMLSDLGSGSTIVSDGQGQRILLQAVEYDEDFDSPTRHELVLPNVEEDCDLEMTAPGARPDFRRMSTEPEPQPPVEEELSRPLKYADRATKLRMARSTPALKHQNSTWFDSVRSVVMTKAGYAPIPTDIPDVPVSTLRGPMKISPALPVAPTLVTVSPVVCDSASGEAADLPAIPPSITITPAPPSSYGRVPLRLRSSLAALRTAVGLPERKAIDDDTVPVLSPRLDWKAQGSQFAGWEKDQQATPDWTPRKASAEMQGLGLGMRGVSGASIDYSKSFFYKPATPPHPSLRTHSSSSVETTSTASADSIDHEMRDVKSNGTTGAAGQKESALGKRRSIKSLRAALLLPVALPPVPPIPTVFLSPSTPPTSTTTPPMEPPVLAISSPGAWEAGLPPRELVLEGEEWDARDGGAVGDWGRRKSKSKKKTLRKKRSAEY